MAFIWGLLPWYVWLAALLVVVLLTYLGVWPLVIGFVRRVPWQVWAILGVGVALMVWLRQHDIALIKKVTDERNTFWQAREDAANKAYADNLAALHRKLEIAGANAEAAQKAHAAELERKDAQHKADRIELDRRRSQNVTPEADRRCDLTRGVILQFNEGAGRANGQAGAGDQATPGAGAESVDASSGVSLDIFSRACEATQDALRTCRDQVAGWQTRESQVITPWITSTLGALSTCIPK